MPDGTATAHLYLPKLATVLREGYRPDDLPRDAVAGPTLANVAPPLSMATSRWGRACRQTAGSTPPSSVASWCRC